MSNDKTTLADVQPGGRVRLGDGSTIEKQARELLAKEWEKLSFDAPVEELREGCELPPVVAAGVRAIVVALSAHPSPDGQRDNSDLLAGLRDVEEHLYFAGSNPSHTATVRAAINALSAQPSPGGQGDAPFPWENFPAYLIDKCEGDTISEEGLQQALASMAKDERYCLAARQPVGEPVAYTDGNEFVCAAEYATMRGLGHDGNGWRPLYAAPPAQAVDLGTGIKAIASERERQLCIEGFSRDSDEQYREGELARAATAYVQLAAMDLQVGSRKHIASQEPPFFWPWAQEWWKPVDARRDLVRAGALIAAQIDLIDSQAVAP
ncbi:hypothetical protein ACJ6WJ_04650 [Stenotrophomonas maltophilia]|uniref:hypothetical protein n=1 Tax=Stenotrophomonas maltophilia TaxID=40324 RepID=UPI0021C6BD4A|nr:hypothetical protein [Stenotrophomonas maltophilia]MBN5011471.1 hypothetical protein [Stenotrophomonas maltophilia]MCU1142519.1 hypothetical protein [Stenotrophomonas maltophilia]